MNRILIVDDVPHLAEQYAYDLRRLGGWETITAAGGEEALSLLANRPIDCVILDLEMPGTDGFAVLEALRRRGDRTPVIVYTGTGDFARCVRAVKLGAQSFLDKGESMEKVVREVELALERARLVEEVETLRRRLDDESPLVGDGAAMAALRARVEKLAPVRSPVLVIGESGSGKEIVARELHRLSGRKGPFLAVNAAALPEALVESELFGHEVGAFTGAIRARKGAFEAARGGTLFLDEIGDLASPAQAKLLRVLESDEITRVGGAAPIPVDARVVAATHRDLDAEAREGRFREDLYHRLAVHLVRVPPLRDRLEDLDVLVPRLLAGCAERLGVAPKPVAPEAMILLRGCSWRRNNVRELRNVLERMLLASEAEMLAPEDVPSEVLADSDPAATARGALQDLKRDAERRIVLAALERNDWHVTRTAADLGLADHASLSKIMRRHGLRKPE